MSFYLLIQIYMFIDITNWRGAAPIAVPSTPNPPSLPSPSWERNANIFFCGWGYKVLKAFTSLTNYFDVTWFNCFKLCGFVWVQSIFFTNRTGDKVWNRVRFVSSKFSLDVESKNLIFHSQYLMNTKLGWSLGHIFLSTRINSMDELNILLYLQVKERNAFTLWLYYMSV